MGLARPLSHAELAAMHAWRQEEELIKKQPQEEDEEESLSWD
jgi:hypothetical protein